MKGAKRIMYFIALSANIGLFLSTAIQVGFAYNLHVPTVPPDISMTQNEAYRLPGLATRGWVAGSCILFAIIGLLAILNKIERRRASNVIVALDLLTLLPIVLAFSIGKLPAGADWIFMHHCIAATLVFLTRPSINSDNRI